MTPLLNATEKKQTGLCSFIPKAARVKMQQHSSEDHTDTLGKEGGREGEELSPLCPRQQHSYFLPGALVQNR